MSVSLSRRQEALSNTCRNLIERYGQSQCVVIDLTFKKHHSIHTIKKAMRKFARRCRGILPRMIGVPGFTTRSCHVHFLAVFSDNLPKPPVFKNIIKEARVKSGFSFKYTISPIKKNPEAISRYLAENFGQSIQYLTIPPNKAPGQIVLFSGIPREWRVKANSFTRLTPHSRRFRASMNRLAELAGTPVDDWKALERTLGTRADTIRRILFGLFSRIPSGQGGLSSEVFQTVFPALRQFKSADHTEFTAMAAVCSEVAKTV